MAARDILSYRLLWFEDKPPPEYPVRAMAAVTTHDLPTVAGLWSGSDLDDQSSLGMEPNVESTEAMHKRLQDITGVPADASPDEAVVGMYTALGTAPSMLLAAALDDTLAVAERPNMPGTIDSWPNWSIALPVPLDDLMTDPRPRAVARALSRPAPTSASSAGPPNTGPRPGVTEPAVSDPCGSEPAMSEPGGSDPGGAEPAVSGPAVSGPAVSRPAAAEGDPVELS